VIVEIDWREFERKKYLENVPVSVREREPEIFHGRKTGTKNRISDLRNAWDRGTVGGWPVRYRDMLTVSREG